MTETGGPAWRQTIFYPFADFAKLGRGTVLKVATSIRPPTIASTAIRAVRRRWNTR